MTALPPLPFCFRIFFRAGNPNNQTLYVVGEVERTARDADVVAEMGRALENRARAFWQSRLTTTGTGLAQLPDLADIRALADAVRTGWQDGSDA